MKNYGPVIAVLFVACSSAPSQTAATPRSSPPTTPVTIASAGRTSSAAQLPTSLRFTKVGQLQNGGPAAQRDASPPWTAPLLGGQLVRFSPLDGASPVPLPAKPLGNPQGIVVAADGSVWISESDSVLPNSRPRRPAFVAPRYAHCCCQ